MDADPTIVRILTEGYKIQFLSLPPLQLTPASRVQYQCDPQLRQVLQLAVGDMVEKSAIEIAPSGRGFYSRIFLVPKTSGKWRPIIDLSVLNQHIHCPSFVMETPQIVMESLRTGLWLTSLDLKDAYFHVPIHQDHRKYLRFCHQGTAWQFKSLPFGICTAPWLFTKIVSQVQKYAHLYGVRLHVYLDDWLITCGSRQESREHTTWLLHLIQRLGWVVNMEKSELTPSLRVVYLGLDINTVTGLACPSLRRVNNWLELSSNFVAKSAQPAILWLRLLGHLISLEKLVPYGRLRIRPIQWNLSLNWRMELDSRTKLIPINSETRESIRWWQHMPHLTKGVKLGTVEIDHYLYTDSSEAGWGAHLLPRETAGLWKGDLRALHINAKELKAVGLGLLAFTSILAQSTVAIMSDNTSTVAYLKNQGGTRSRVLCNLATDICLWSEQQGVTLVPRHVPGHLNVHADRLSRKNQILKSEWSLCQTVADKIFLVWGRPQVDLFALERNAKLPTYMSPIPEKSVTWWTQ